MKHLILASLIVFSFAVVASAQGVVEGTSGAMRAETGSLSAGQPGPWWGNRASGRLGGVMGSFVGLVGATIGALGGMGRARRFVMTLVAVTILLGVCMRVLCGIALASSQPDGVWYPLGLTGLISVAVFAPLRGAIRKRYEQAELRKMAAADIE